MSVIHIGSDGKTQAAPSRRRLILGIDATSGHEEIWKIACTKLSEGNLVQLAYFSGCCGRGVDLPTEEFATSPRCSNAADLADAMSHINAAPGCSEIGSILHHALAEHAREPIDGIVLIGDHCDEPYRELAALAADVAAAGIPIHTWLAGDQPAARNAYRMLALSTGGEPFTIDGGDRELLGRQFEALCLVC